MVEKNTNEYHGKASGDVSDQVYFNPTDGCWRIVHRGQVLPNDWPSRARPKLTSSSWCGERMKKPTASQGQVEIDHSMGRSLRRYYLTELGVGLAEQAAAKAGQDGLHDLATVVHGHIALVQRVGASGLSGISGHAQEQRVCRSQ